MKLLFEWNKDCVKLCKRTDKGFEKVTAKLYYMIMILPFP